MREYLNLSEVSSLNIDSHNILWSTTLSSENGNFTRLYLVNNIKNIKDNEYLYLTETSEIRNHHIYSKLDGLIFTKNELIEYSTKNKESSLFWNNVNQLFNQN